MRVLLVQLASSGDCLFVTTIARQIKEIDYPNCELTWLIGSKYTKVIFNNPYVDNVIEVPIVTYNDIMLQRELIAETLSRLESKETFDRVFITDYTSSNLENWFGTTRSSLFRNYPHKVIVNPQPLIFLTDKEKKDTSEFCDKNQITSEYFNILFECSPQSGQSKMSFAMAKSIAQNIAAKNSKFKFILSSDVPFESLNPNIIDGSKIGWRENAELANRCQLLVGCSSGISWLCTSNWTRSIPIIQIIDPDYTKGRYSASMKMDFEYFGISTSNIVELNNASESTIEACILDFFKYGLAFTKKKYDETNHSVYRNISFLRESKISNIKKILFFLMYHSIANISRVYRAIKPKWFTPMAWKRRI